MSVARVRMRRMCFMFLSLSGLVLDLGRCIAVLIGRAGAGAGLLCPDLQLVR